MISYFTLVVQLLFLQQPTCEAQSLLWKVSDSGNKHVSYLYGTMHTPDSVFVNFSPVVLSALKECDVFACEMDITSLQNEEGVLALVMMKDSLLPDLYTPEEWAFVRKTLEDKLDPLTFMTVPKLKPFFTLGFLEATAEGVAEGPVVDEKLTRIAIENEMEVVSLETLDDVGEAINSIPLKEQAKMLYDYLLNYESYVQQNETLRSLYYSQDLQGMMALGNAEMISDNFREALVDNRNRRFVDHLKKDIRKKNVFCAVGALHLPGESGLIQSLRNAGYTVEPVYFSWEN
jgi:uncharacterized protein YbaP (TraB family)